MLAGAVRNAILIAVAQKVTYEQVCALPDDGKHYEIIDGELLC